METIKGYVEHIVYRNEENGYTVFNLNNDDGDLTCVGKLHYIEEGGLLELTGEYTTHRLYGTQLQVETARVCEPEDLVSIERYLGSGASKAIPVRMFLNCLMIKSFLKNKGRRRKHIHDATDLRLTTLFTCYIILLKVSG